MKRITPQEALSYTPLVTGDPLLTRKATAFTLTPCTGPGSEGWEEITYYTDDSVNDFSMNALELIHREWNNMDLDRDRGDEELSNAE